MDIDEWKSKNLKPKGYAHFDKKVGLNTAWYFVSDPQKVATHGFYPFIHYTKVIKKVKKNKQEKSRVIEKIKEREICYSAHLDRCIYQYYGFKLNELYNNRVLEDRISDCAIAYRTDLGKSNVHFAHEAFNFIKKQKSYIIVGDFSKFFDNLDHEYLKQRLCSLLQVEKLPDDFFNVFKNITKFSKWELEDILAVNDLPNNENGVKALNDKDTVLTLEQFKAYKKKYIKPNKENYGIPQGSAISAILSNIYMMEFDKAVKALTDSYKGKYMRYSDDFIVVLPDTADVDIRILWNKILEIIKSTKNIVVHPEKTQVFYFDKNLILWQSKLLKSVSTHVNYLDYLGFTFDGKDVRLRDSTVFKFYNRAYRKIKTIVNSKFSTKNGNIISCKNLYKFYSIRGAKIDQGNFISYVKRCEDVFGRNEQVGRVNKVHMYKLKKRLKTKKG